MEEMQQVENIEEVETVQETETVEVVEQVESVESSEKKKALLIKLSSLGDVVFNIPLANALKDAGYEVTWLVSERGIQVVENNPCVDKVILAPVQKWRKRGLKFENFKEYLTLIKQLRDEKFDVAIDSQMILKSMVWTMFCGAKRRIIAKDAREGSIIGGNEWIEKIFDKENPIVLNYLKFATHLDCFPSEIKVTLPPRSEMVVKKVDNLLANVDKTKPLAVIAPATTWVAKHWNKNHWRNVVNELEDNYSLVFTGGPNDKELIDYIRNGKHTSLAGKTDLMDLVEVFSRARVVLAPDSGSAHLAWASRNPAVVTIFTCTPKGLLAPYGDKKKYIAVGGEGLGCQPCFRRKCTRRKNKNICCDFPCPNDVVKVVQGLKLL